MNGARREERAAILVAEHHDQTEEVASMEAAAAVIDKPPGDSPHSSPSRRVHSVNFEPVTDEWLDVTVNLLRQAGLPKAGRSEVVRVALSELRRALADNTPADTVKFFLDKDVEWRLSRLQSPNSDA